MFFYGYYDKCIPDNPTCFQNNDPLWYGWSDQMYTIPVLEPLNQASGNALIHTQPIDYSDHGFLRISEGIDDTQFHFPGTRYQNWSQANDIWFQGLFGVYWADDTLGGTIDTDGIASLNESPSYGIKTGQPFFVLNLLEELDIPGEWYLDRSVGIMNFWPPAALDGSEIVVALLEEPLLLINDTAHIYFQDITFEEGRADLVNVTNGVDIRVSSCTIRNTGATGIKIHGNNNSINDCHVYNTGADGVWIKRGERTSLTDGNNIVSNCEIYNFGRLDRTYHPGVSLNGVGNSAVHNEIHNAPHGAILITGNDNFIQYNEISNVVQEANDAGAIYIGRD